MGRAVKIGFNEAAWRQFQVSAAEKQQRIHRHLKGLVEALLFAASEPLSPRELARAAKVRRPDIEPVLVDLVEDYRDRGIELMEIAGGYGFRTNARYGAFVRELTARKPVRMSRAQLETLAIVSYRQPITRPEIDDIRGVDSGPVLRTLLERSLIRILGKKEEPGRPLLYGTTDAFLKLFGLKSLSNLPTLREFTELADDSRQIYERQLGERAPEGTLNDGDADDENEDGREEETDGGDDEDGDDEDFDDEDKGDDDENDSDFDDEDEGDDEDFDDEDGDFDDEDEGDDEDFDDEDGDLDDEDDD